MADGTIGNEEELTMERTSGSVFAALGYADPAEVESKSRLVTALNDTIEARGLTQSKAAKIVGTDQPTLSKILNGRTRSYSTDKLADMLNALGRNVVVMVEDLNVAKARGEWQRGCTTVVVVEQDRAEPGERVRKGPLVA